MPRRVRPIHGSHGTKRGKAMKHAGTLEQRMKLAGLSYSRRFQLGPNGQIIDSRVMTRPDGVTTQAKTKIVEAPKPPAIVPTPPDIEGNWICWPCSDDCIYGWGDPYIDEANNPINPPLGTCQPSGNFLTGHVARLFKGDTVIHGVNMQASLLDHRDTRTPAVVSCSFAYNDGIFNYGRAIHGDLDIAAIGNVRAVCIRYIGDTPHLQWFEASSSTSYIRGVHRQEIEIDQETGRIINVVPGTHVVSPLGGAETPSGFYHLEFSQDGTKFAYVKDETTGRVWEADVPEQLDEFLPIEMRLVKEDDMSINVEGGDDPEISYSKSCEVKHIVGAGYRNNTLQIVETAARLVTVYNDDFPTNSGGNLAYQTFYYVTPDTIAPGCGSVFPQLFGQNSFPGGYPAWESGKEWRKYDVTISVLVNGTTIFNKQVLRYSYDREYYQINGDILDSEKNFDDGGTLTYPFPTKSKAPGDPHYCAIEGIPPPSSTRTEEEHIEFPVAAWDHREGLVCSVSIGKHTRSQVGDDFSGSLENHWEVKFGDGYNFSRTNRVEGRFVIPDEMEFYWWPAFWPDWRDAFNGDEGIATATFGASRNIATPNNYDRIAYIQGPSSNTGFPDYISTKPLECRIGMLSLKSGRFVIWSQAIDVDDVYYYLNYYTEGDILADLSIGGENNPRICATSGNKYMGMIAQSVR